MVKSHFRNIGERKTEIRPKEDGGSAKGRRRIGERPEDGSRGFEKFGSSEVRSIEKTEDLRSSEVWSFDRTPLGVPGT